MAQNLKTLCFNIWKSKYDRKGIQSEYKPYCLRYIGVEDINQYPNILKTLYDKSEQCQYSLFFDGSIPFQPDFDIISYVGNELTHMDITNLKSQDIVLFNNEILDKIFLESLDTVVNLALKQESFFNNSSKNDFILKLIIWTFLYIKPLSEKFEDNYSPKCFYYGDISKHEVYFLMMLHLMTFDVIYINPLRDETWTKIDTMQLSEQRKDQCIVTIDNLHNKIANAKNIEQDESVTVQLQREMDNTFLSGSGVYRAWQFRDGDVKTTFIHSTIIDLMQNYAEPAKVRAGFDVKGTTVTIPNYLFQVDGQFDDIDEYIKLVNTCISTPNTLVLTDKGESLFGNPLREDEKLKLIFCKLSDGQYDIEEIKKMPFYKWDKYRDSLEDFILKKINVVLADKLFKKKFTQTEEIEFVSSILSINENIIKMADNFDYTDKVPKIVIFLNNEDFIEDETLRLIGFISKLGFDIVIFSPAGLISIDSVFQLDKFNNERLNKMVYDCTLENIKKKAKTPKNFLKKFFM